MRFIFVPVMIVPFLLSVNVEAKVLCAAKTGVLALRSACKKSEKVVNLASVGTTGPAGPSDGHYVMDANGATVGEYFFSPGYSPGLVTIKVNGDYYSIGPISASGIPDFTRLYYLQSNCAGQAYINKYSNFIFVTQSNLGGANKAYLKGSQLYLLTQNDISLNEANVAMLSVYSAGTCSNLGYNGGSPLHDTLIPFGTGTVIYDFSVNPAPWTIR